MLSALSTNIRELGWRDGLIYVISRALEVASGGRVRLYRYYFVAQPVPAGRMLAESRSARMKIGPVLRGDPLLAQFPVPPHVIERRFADGARCLAARVGDELAGYLWLTTREYMEDEVRCLYVLDPPERAAWDFDVYVAPAYRLGRTFVRLWEAANALLRSEGYEWSISRISAFKAHSLASHGRLGTVRLDSGTFIAIGPVQIALLGLPPFVHVAWSRSRYPRVRLAPPTEPRPSIPPVRAGTESG